MATSEQLIAEQRKAAANVNEVKSGQTDPKLEQLVRGGKKILAELKAKVPSSLFSLDKEQFIGNELIENLNNESRLVLRNLVNGFLEDMRKIIIVSPLIGVFTNLAGLMVSLVLDLPVGSCIVLVSPGLFALLVLLSPKRKRMIEEKEVKH